MLAVLHDNFVLAKLVLILLELREGILVVFFVSPRKKPGCRRDHGFSCRSSHATVFEAVNLTVIRKPTLPWITKNKCTFTQMSFVDIMYTLVRSCTGGKKRGNGLEATCVYRFVAKRHRLNKKLEVLLQPHAVHES